MLRRSLKFYVVNAFAEESLGGNPAAIFPEADGLTETQMQAIARQMNLIESVFIFPSQGKGDVTLRYFTPSKELPLAGAPTIAAWIALIHHGKFSCVGGAAEFTQTTAAGTQKIYLSLRDDRMFVRMDQPRPEFIAIDAPLSEVAEIFSIEVSDIDSTLPVAGVDTGLGHVIFAVTSLKSLMKIQRNIEPLRAFCSHFGLREAQIFTWDTYNANCHVHTRNICPREGFEDPACGVGSSALLAFLMKYSERMSGDSVHVRVEQGHVVSMPSVVDVWGKRSSNESFNLQIGGSGLVTIQGDFYI